MLRCAMGLRRHLTTRPRSGTGRNAARIERRLVILQQLAAKADSLCWSATLMRLLVQELHVEEDFHQLLGSPRHIPTRRYPQAVAIALAIRHSWRLDDLAEFAKRLRLPLPTVNSRYRAKIPTM